MPFAGYKNFADCVSKNRNKKNPQAYCGFIMHQVEGKTQKKDIYQESKMTSKNMPLVHDLIDMMDRVDLRIFKAKWYGQTNGRYIKTNTKKGDVVNTIVHELMHIKYPEKSEKEIQVVSAQVEGTLSMRDQAKLLENYESGVSRASDRALMYSNPLIKVVMAKKMSVSSARKKYSKIQ